MAVAYRIPVAYVNRISVVQADIISVMNTSGDRLKTARENYARDHVGYGSAGEAARRHGWNESTYRSHENNQTAVPPQWATEYAKVYKVSAGWILTGEGSAVGLDAIVKDWPLAKQQAARQMLEQIDKL